MPAFVAEPGMPYWLELTSSQPRKSTYFYGEFLGWEFEEVSPTYRVARVGGLPVAAIVEKPAESQLPDTWVTAFLARNLATTVTRAETLGAHTLAGPTDVWLGQMALLADPAGALVGLAEAAEENFVAAGEPGTAVWHELVATNKFDQVADFYGELLDWQLLQREGYATATSDGAPFAGIWDAAGAFPAKVPSFWQSYLGVSDIDAAIRRVPELGGEVIREPWDSPFGRLGIVADSTGATLTLCEVEEPAAEPHEGDPLAGLDLGELGLQ